MYTEFNKNLRCQSYFGFFQLVSVRYVFSEAHKKVSVKYVSKNNKLDQVSAYVCVAFTQICLPLYLGASLPYIVQQHGHNTHTVNINTGNRLEHSWLCATYILEGAICEHWTETSNGDIHTYKT